MAARTQAPRRRAGRQGRDAARQCGHERHAAHRRAPRAAHHLHGRPAAHPEGRRRQPAARDEGSRRSRRDDQPDRARVHRRPARSRSTSRSITIANLESACATSSRRARKRRCSSSATRRCATARSSRSSTPPRAPASRRSASSPRACAAATEAGPAPARQLARDRARINGLAPAGASPFLMTVAVAVPAVASGLPAHVPRRSAVVASPSAARGQGQAWRAGGTTRRREDGLPASCRQAFEASELERATFGVAPAF